MNDENQSPPANGNPLGGAALRQAMEHDAAQRGRIFTTADVIEANKAPCPVCSVKEGTWCAGAAIGASTSTESVAEWCHTERLALARADVSRALDRQLAELKSKLPTGELLKANPVHWQSAMAYADLVIKMAMSEAIQRVARELNVEPTWLATLPQLRKSPPLVDAMLRPPSRPLIGRPPIPPVPEPTPQQVSPLESRVTVLETALASLVDSFDKLTKAMTTAIDRLQARPT